MPRAPKVKYYAVRVGRQGAQIYTSWEETKQNVSRFPGAVHKSFNSRSDAQEWLDAVPSTFDMQDRSEERVPLAGPASSTSGRRRINSASDESAAPGSTSSADILETGAPSQRESIVLSPEQRAVLKMVEDGQSVFFTGSAGTGKSVLLREIIKRCGGPASEHLAVTAATGVASVNIGGSTLQSWAGIGLGRESAKNLAGKLLGLDKVQRLKEQKTAERSVLQQSESDMIEMLQAQDLQINGSPSNGSKRVPRVVERWRKVRTLIIDEISMVDGVLFDKLEFIARVLRRNDLPFGGIQLVISGDFFQLPPVSAKEKDKVLQPVKFCFEAETWSKCVDRPIILHRVFRQRDEVFVEMLNAVRLGKPDEKVTAEFKKLSRPVIYDDDIEPTDLFPTRVQVDTANQSRLQNLPGPTHQYNARDTAGYDHAGMPIPGKRVAAALERLIAPKSIKLKVGAQVMLIKNLVQGELVNGSVGRVVDFSTSQDALKKGAQIAQIEGRGGDASEQQIPDHILNSRNSWPMVEFQGGRKLLCVPSTFEVDNADGLVEARREQVPLILAWALSIHKSQGQTLQRVRVDLGRVFEYGQAYVALSRATNMETLQVLNFDDKKVKAHKSVLQWMSHSMLEEETYDEEYLDEM